MGQMCVPSSVCFHTLDTLVAPSWTRIRSRLPRCQRCLGAVHSCPSLLTLSDRRPHN